MSPKWFAAFAAVLAIVFFFIAFRAEAADPATMQRQALSVTWQLNEDCSATLVHSAYDYKAEGIRTTFLTAKHCVDFNRQMFIDRPVYQDGRVVKKERYIAKLRGKHFKYDLALVDLIDSKTHFPEVAKIAPKDGMPPMGAQVFTVGYPVGWSLTVTSGLFGALETIDFPHVGAEYFRATPDIAGGSSGGGMYRLTGSGDFELIGVASAKHRDFSYIGFYVPIYAIHEYLSVALPDAVGGKK